MKAGEVYQWKENWHETFQHLLVGSADTSTSFIQTIWIDKKAISSDCLLPAIPTSYPQPQNQSFNQGSSQGSSKGSSQGSSQGGAGIRAEQFKYMTDYMIFIRMIDVEKDGFDSHGYGEPVPEASKLDDSEERETELGYNLHFQDFVSYFWYEFLLFSPDGQNCNICTWIFLEQNDNGIPSKPEKVFYKYFEETFPSNK